MINATKTKYMIAGGQRGSGRVSGSEIVLGGEKFAVEEEFVYLGALVTCENDVIREIKRHITAESRAFYGLRNQSKSCTLQTKTKLALYKTLILPVVLHGHESCELKEVDLKAFGVFERKVLRTILGGKLENDIWWGPNSRSGKRAAIQQDQAEGRRFKSHRSRIFSGWIFSRLPRA